MQVVKAPDPRLKAQTKPVKKITPALLQTIKEMIKLTKTFKDPEGVGLASTQVGLSERFFVARLAEDESKRARLHESNQRPRAVGIAFGDVRPSNPTQRAKRWVNYQKGFVAILNPKILSYSKRTKTYFEGCLSIPNIWGNVKRHTWVKVSYQDTKDIITKVLKGIPAWIFQHEVDHLDGILFTQRVLQQKGKFYKFTGKDKTGTDIFEEVTI